MRQAVHLRVAAVIWLLGATVYLVCEAIAAAGFDGYSYTADYISDLGVSPVMNVGAFMAHGTLLLLGALVLTCGRPRGWIGCAFVAAAATNAVGNVLVGTFPSGAGHIWHGVGAGMAIVGGNVAAIVAGMGGAVFGASPALRRFCMCLGAFGLLCLAVLVVDGACGSRVLDVGLVERGAVYPIIAWELTAGIALLRRSFR